MPKRPSEDLKVALVAICASFEKPYLEEWVAWHTAKCKFDKVFLYCNNWTCDLDLGPEVEFIQFDGEAVQNAAYNDFLENRSSDYDYALFIDCDEFLDLGKKYKSVQQLFAKAKQQLGMSINWVLYGDSGVHFNDIPGEYGVLKRFYKCDKEINKHVKQAVNLKLYRNLKMVDKMKFICPHCTNISLRVEGFVDASFSKMVIGPWNEVKTPTAEYEDPVIAHFFCKTREEWTERRKHGRADTPKSSKAFLRSPEEFDAHNKNDIERPLI